MAGIAGIKDCTKTQLPILVLLATVVVITAGIPAAAANASCGMIVTQDLVLDTDLTCAGAGLIVGADGITIDLNNHTLTGDGTALGIDNRGGFDHVTIKNGVLAGFASGIALMGTSDNQVSRIEVLNSGQAAGAGAGFGIVVQSSDHATVTRTIIHDNEQTGVVSRWG